MKKTNERVWLYGIHACKAALHNANRTFYQICYLNEKTAELVNPQINFTDLHVKKVDKQWFEKKFGLEAVHQGIAIQVSPLPPYSFEDLREITAPNQCVIILDQVSDPHNIGAIIRSAVAFGAQALIITDRNAPCESGTLAKSASGALELLPLIRCSNLAQALENLKKIGFWTYGFAEEAKDYLHTTNLIGKIALILGAEGKGMRRLTIEHCDVLLRLHTCDSFTTLNVSNAAALALYTVFCQHYPEGK